MLTAAVMAMVLAGVTAQAAAAPTAAAWTDLEHAGTTVKAGQVNTPAPLACTTNTLTAQFTWARPAANGITVTGYAFTLTGPNVNVSGNKPVTELVHAISLADLPLATATYTFTIRSIGPSPWTSEPLSGRLFVTLVNLNTLTANCSVP